jgi:hypothetical protein
MNDDRIDLSPLDPTRDELRWERMVRSVAARGRASRSLPEAVLLDLVRRARPALAAAAVLALCAWLPSLFGTPRAEPRAMDPTLALAWSDSPSEAAQLFSAGGSHGR